MPTFAQEHPHSESMKCVRAMITLSKRGSYAGRVCFKDYELFAILLNCSRGAHADWMLDFGFSEADCVTRGYGGGELTDMLHLARELFLCVGHKCKQGRQRHINVPWSAGAAARRAQELTNAVGSTKLRPWPYWLPDETKVYTYEEADWQKFFRTEAVELAKMRKQMLIERSVTAITMLLLALGTVVFMSRAHGTAAQALAACVPLGLLAKGVLQSSEVCVASESLLLWFFICVVVVFLQRQACKCWMRHRAPQELTIDDCVCTYCDQRFSNKLSRVAHEKRKHADWQRDAVSDGDETRMNVKKSIRSKKAKDERKMRRKIVPRRPSRPDVYFCTICNDGKDWKRIGSLREHEATHSTDRPFKCAVVGCTSNGFSRRFTLKQHASTHSTVKPFHCTVVGCTSNGFSRRSTLKRHAEKQHKAQVRRFFPAGSFTSSFGRSPHSVSTHQLVSTSRSRRQSAPASNLAE